MPSPAESASQKRNIISKQGAQGALVQRIQLQLQLVWTATAEDEHAKQQAGQGEFSV